MYFFRLSWYRLNRASRLRHEHEDEEPRSETPQVKKEKAKEKPKEKSKDKAKESSKEKSRERSKEKSKEKPKLSVVIPSPHESQDEESDGSKSKVNKTPKKTHLTPPK
jgi:hypothetical protein